MAWGGSLHWHDLLVLAITYTLTGLGITVGYHRLFTYRSFKLLEGLPLGRLVHEVGVFGLEDRDHGAGSLLDDLRDQIECMLALPPSRPALHRDHVVAHRGHQPSGRLEAFRSLVGDENAKRIGRFRAH